MGGQILYSPTPPHPWKDPSRGGGCFKEGGGMKFLPRESSKYAPHPSPLEMRFGQKGKGGVDFFLEHNPKDPAVLEILRRINSQSPD